LPLRRVFLTDKVPAHRTEREAGDCHEANEPQHAIHREGALVACEGALAVSTGQTHGHVAAANLGEPEIGKREICRDGGNQQPDAVLLDAPGRDQHRYRDQLSADRDGLVVALGRQPRGQAQLERTGKTVQIGLIAHRAALNVAGRR